MASIRLTFPDKDEPSVIALNGSRITVGRLPFNTVQILDRTISGFHAELILEGEHYRLHDRGSTNGTFVNGEPATDFHLREACRISFGTVDCDFDPAAGSELHAEAVPTRGEINTVRQENAELRGTLTALREQLASLLDTKPAAETGEAVARDEFNKVVTEREALKEAQVRHEQEIGRLKSEVAVLRRDRENLQKAWDATKAELARVQRPVDTVAVVDVREARPPAAAAVPVTPVAPTPAPPAPAPKAVVEEAKTLVIPPASKPAVPFSKPVAPPAAPVAKPAVNTPPVAPVAKPVVNTPPAPTAPAAPAVPMAPPMPPSRPAAPVSKPPGPISPPTGKPFPAPRPVGSPAPRPATVPVAAAKPPGTPNSSGIRPFPKGVPAGTPVPAASPAPAPAPKPASVLQPRTAVRPVHAPAVGPKGTQKIS
jgi:hypothetical protein